MLTRVVHMSTLHSTCQHYIRQRVKLDHFGYFKGKIVPVVSLGCSVVQGGYLDSKIESLPNIFICLNGSLAQAFTWQRTFTPGHLFALGCFRLALNWIHHSNFPKQSLSIQNVGKRSVDFSCWAPSAKNTIASDTAMLLKSFSFISVYLLSTDQCDVFNFPFRDIIRTL